MDERHGYQPVPGLAGPEWEACRVEVLTPAGTVEGTVSRVVLTAGGVPAFLVLDGVTVVPWVAVCRLRFPVDPFSDVRPA